MRLRHVDAAVLCAFDVDSQEVADVALVGNVKARLFYVGDCCVDLTAFGSGQDAVVGVDNVDGAALIEEARVNFALWEADFLGQFFLQVLKPYLPSLFLTMHVLMDFENIVLATTVT